MRHVFACFVGLAALAGCDPEPGAPVCTAEVKPAVRLVLTDAATAAPIRGATALLAEGAFEAQMVEGPAGQYTGAAERAGTYRLTVSAPGYDSQIREGIVVTADRCHVDTREVEIALQPATMGTFVWILFDGTRVTVGWRGR